jgi:hypothetical protein
MGVYNLTKLLIDFHKDMLVLDEGRKVARLAMMENDVMALLDESPTTVDVSAEEGVEDLQEQVRAHIRNDKLFDWDEALSGNEMTHLEQLLLTFNPLCPPGSIGYEEQVRHIARHRGALSVRQQGDAGKLVLWNGIEGEMEDVESLEHARKWLIENYTEEGIHPDIELCEVYRQVGSVVVVDGKKPGTSRIEVQPTQSTPTPPGIVEQLRKANPFNRAEYNSMYNDGYLNACENLATLLSEDKGQKKESFESLDDNK